MKQLRNIAKYLVFLILVFCGVVLVSCGNDNGRTVISCSETQIDFILGEDKTKTFNIDISGGQFDIDNLAVESYEEDSIIEFKVQKKSNNSASVEISPLRPGTATIKVSGAANSAEPQEILVNVIMPVESISLKQQFENKIYAIKGGAGVNLYSLNFVNYKAKGISGYESFETNQKGFRVELKNQAQQNVVLENGVLTVSDNFEGDSVWLTAYSNYYSEGKTNLKFDFEVKVLSKITTEVFVNADKGYGGATPITNGQTISLFPKEDVQNSAVIYVYAYVSKQADEIALLKSVDASKFDLELVGQTFDNSVSAYKFTYKLTSFNAGFSDLVGFTVSYKNYSLGSENQDYFVKTNELAVKTYNRSQSVVANGTAGNINVTVYENISSISKGSTITLGLTPGNLASEHNQITLVAEKEDLPFDLYVLNATKTGYTQLQWQNKTATVAVGTKLFALKNVNYNSEENASAIIYAQDSYYEQRNVDRTKIEINISVKPGASGIYLAKLNENNQYSAYGENLLNLEDSQISTIFVDLNEQKTQIIAISPSNFDIGLNSAAKVLNSNLANATDLEVVDTDENYVYVKFSIVPTAVGKTKLNVYLQDGSEIAFNLTIISKLNNFNVSVNSEEVNAIAKYYEKQDGKIKLAIQNGTNIQLNYQINPTNAQYKLNYKVLGIDSNKSLSEISINDYIAEFDNVSFENTTTIINVDRLRNYGIIEAASSTAEGKALVQISVSGMTETGEYENGFVYYVLVEIYKSVDAFNVSSSLISIYSYDSVGSENIKDSISEFTITASSNKGTPTYLNNLKMFKDLSATQEIVFDNAGVANVESNGEVLLKITKTLVGNVYKFTVQAMSAKQEQFVFTFKLAEIAQNEQITALVRVNVKKAVEIAYIELVNAEDEIYIDNFSNENGSEFTVLCNIYGEDNKEPLNNKLRYQLSSSLTSNGVKIDENGKITAPAGISAVGTLLIYPESNYFDGRIVGEPVVTLNVVVANGDSKESAIRIYSSQDFAKIKDEEGKDKSNLHYVLMGDITVSSPIDAFSGHLYGDFGGKTSTITCASGAIFTEIKSGASVENLNVLGLLAITNNGSINNVHVLAETEISSNTEFVGGIANINNGSIENCVVEGDITGENVGGIAGQNAGTISGCLFAGSITASGNAGGIAAENGGIISGCKVEKWSENTDSMISATGAASTYVGAIAGINTNKIEKTYAYAYNQTNADIAANNGAKVGGLVGLNSGDISECMTNFKLVSDFTQTNSGTISNCYILGENFIARHYVGVTQTDSSYSYDEDVWAVEDGYNNNLPYLKNAKYPKPDSQINIGIEDDEDILHSSDFVVLYYYQTLDAITDAKALIDLQNKNTYSLSKILSSTENLYIKSNSSIVRVNGNQLVVSGVGKATLSLTSHYATQDCEGMSITVYVIYPISEFNIYNGTSINGGNVVKQSVSIRRAADTIYSSAVNNKVMLNGKVYEIKSNLYAVLFNAKNAADYDANDAISGIAASFTGGGKALSIGSFIVKPYVLENIENFELNATLALQNTHTNGYYSNFDDSDFTKINELIAEKFNKTINITTYRGATSLKTTITEGELAPANVLSFEVEIESDSLDESVSVDILDGENPVREDLFAITTPTLQKVGNVFRGTIYISVQDSERINVTERKEYSIKLSTSNNDVIKTVKLTVIPQKVINIAYNHYSQKEGSGESITINPISTSVLKPGVNGILAINLFPNFAAYEKIEISGLGDNGKYVLLQQMFKDEQVFKVANYGYSSERDNELLTIYPTSKLRSDGGMIYVRTKLSEDVKDGEYFPILIKVYQKDGTILNATCTIVSETVNKADIAFEDGSKEAVLVRGDTVKFYVTVNEDEELGSVTLINYNSSSTQGDFLNLNRGNYTIENGKKVYEITISAGVNAEINDDGVVQIETVMNRFINGKYEHAYDYATVRIVDFVVEKIGISGAPRDVDVFESYVGLEKTLKFDITLSKIPTATSGDQAIINGINRIRTAQENFLSHFTYESNAGGRYEINKGKGNNILLNLFDANGNPVYVNGVVVNNEYFTFKEPNATSVKVLGTKAGTTNMSLKFNYLLPGTTEELTYSYNFKIQTKIYQDEDTPIQINTAAEFLYYMNATTTQSGEAESYILMNDIYLENLTPIANTNLIASLDGNNKIITIKSFNGVVNNGSLNIALFNTISEGTTLKNLTINLFELEDIIIDEQTTSRVNIAGLFIYNYGIVYNCEVACLDLKSSDNELVEWQNYTKPTSADGNGIKVYFNANAKAQDKRDSTTVVIAGLGINNESQGKITNSRVGSESYERITEKTAQNSIKITPKHLQIVGQGEIAGFVANNRGLISASAFTNAKITNYAKSDATTAGFVLKNEINAKIAASYARGYKTNAEANLYSYSEGGISANGISAGFVYENFAEISDCYAKINLTGTGMASSRLVSGFVYQNNNGALVARCYAASNLNGLENDSTTRKMAFSGVNAKGDSMQNGVFSNCYYIVIEYDTESILEEQYETGAYAMSAANLSYEDFYGFNFNLNSDYDGVWRFEKGSPELISANHIATSVRYLVDNYNGVIGSKIFPYVEGYEYGSIKNPIIIKTADEFNRAFGKTNNPNINDSTAIQDHYNGNEVYGNYRLVSDIDFDQTTNVGNVKIVSANMNLTTRSDSNITSGIFDGNGFTLKNVDISTNEQNYQSLGLFSSIRNGAIFKNTNITIRKIGNNEKSQVGVVCGTLTDSAIINVSISPVVSTGDNTSEVVGINVVGGVVGLVKGNSRLSNLSSSVTVTSTYSSSIEYGRTLLDYKNLGYSGGIAGIVDILSNASSDAQVNKLYVYGKNVVISGYNVGGVFGYIGRDTIAKDILFEVSGALGDFHQQLRTTGKVVGGIVAISYGEISEARIEHEQAVQAQIDGSLGGYYSSNAAKLGYRSLFVANGPVEYVGGLIGKMFGGKLTNCYSKIDVVVPNAQFAGGIIGYNKSNGTFRQIYAFGDVDALTAGGIIGQNEGNPTFIQTVAMNFYSKTNSKIVEALDLISKIEAKINGQTYSDLSELQGILNNQENGDSLQATEENNKLLITATAGGTLIVEINNKLVYTIKNLGSFVGENKTDSTIKIAASDFANNTLKINGITLNLNKNGLSYTTTSGNTTTTNYLNDLYISLQDFVSAAKDVTKVQRMFLGALDPWDADMWEVKDGEYLPHLVFGITSKVLYIEKPSDFSRLYKYTKPGCVVVIGDNPATAFNPYTYSGTGASGGYSEQELRGLTGSQNGLVFNFSNFSTTYTTISDDFKGSIYGESSGKTYLLQNANTIFSSINGGTVRNLTFGSDKESSKQEVSSPLLANGIFNAILENVNVQNVNATLNVDRNTTSVGVLANTISLNEFYHCSFQNVELTVSGTGKTTDEGAVLNVGLIAGEIEILTGSVNAKISDIHFENCTITNEAVAKTLNTGLIAGSLELKSNCEIDSTSAINCQVEIKPTSPVSDTTLQTGMLFGTISGEVNFNDVTIKNTAQNECKITISVNTNIKSTYVGGYAGKTGSIANLIYNGTNPLINGLTIDYSGLKVGTIYAGLMFGECENGIDSNTASKTISGTITNTNGTTALVSHIGGVVGVINNGESTIRNITTSGEIAVKVKSLSSNMSSVGGVVGSVKAGTTLSNIAAKNKINVENGTTQAFYIAVGGVIGSVHDKKITAISISVGDTSNSSSNNSITANGGYIHLGGVLGYYEEKSALNSTITATVSSTSTIDVTSSDLVSVGGIVGKSETGSTLSVSGTVSSTITVSGNAHYNIGGVVGDFAGSVSSATFNGKIGIATSGCNLNVGGIAGSTTGNIASSYVSGDIGITKSDNSTLYISTLNIGGIAGKTSAAVSGTYSWGNISVKDGASITNLYIGGVVGYNNGNITNIANNYTLTSIYNENFGILNQNKNVRAVVGNSTNTTPTNGKNHYSAYVNLAIDNDNFAENKTYNDMLDNFRPIANSLLTAAIDISTPDGTKLNPYNNSDKDYIQSFENLTKMTYYSFSDIANAGSSVVTFTDDDKLCAYYSTGAGFANKQLSSSGVVPANVHIIGNGSTWKSNATPVTTNNGYIAGFKFNVTATGSQTLYGITETNNGIIFGCSIEVKGNNNSYENGKNWKSVTAGIAGTNNGLISDVSVVLYVKEATAGAVANNTGAIANTLVNGVVQNGAQYGFNGGSGKVFNSFTSIRTTGSIFAGSTTYVYYDQNGTEKTQTGTGVNLITTATAFSSLGATLNTNNVETRFNREASTNFGYPKLKLVGGTNTGDGSNASKAYQIPNVGVLERINSNIKNYQLLTDVDYSKGHIASHTAVVAPLGINFNGNGYIIKNIPSISGVSVNGLGGTYAGYFDYVKSADIKNIEFNYASGATVGSDSTTYSGGVVGYAENTIFDGVRSSGATIKGQTVGGLIGYAAGGSIKNSHNFNAVGGLDNSGNPTSITAGGVVGHLQNCSIGENPFNTTVSNYGDVFSKQHAGGIIGEVEVLSAFSIRGLLNGGDVTVKENTSTGTLAAGGIVGYSHHNGQIETLTIYRCGNIGTIDVSSTRNITYCGGIVGKGHASSEIKSCVNSGRLKIKGQDSNSYVGGIVGSLGSAGCSISECSMTGKMTVFQKESFGWLVGTKGSGAISITNNYIEPSTVLVTEDTGGTTPGICFSDKIYRDYKVGFKTITDLDSSDNYGVNVVDWTYTRDVKIYFVLPIVGSQSSFTGSNNTIYINDGNISSCVLSYMDKHKDGTQTNTDTKYYFYSSSYYYVSFSRYVMSFSTQSPKITYTLKYQAIAAGASSATDLLWCLQTTGVDGSNIGVKNDPFYYLSFSNNKTNPEAVVGSSSFFNGSTQYSYSYTYDGIYNKELENISGNTFSHSANASIPTTVRTLDNIYLTWNSKAVSYVLNGNTYEVYDVTGLADISKNISTYKYTNIVLMDDIDLTGRIWTPIGADSFSGSFDGQGHTITGMMTNHHDGGLFYKLSSKNESDFNENDLSTWNVIQNFTIRNSRLRPTYSQYSGAIADSMYVNYSSSLPFIVRAIKLENILGGLQSGHEFVYSSDNYALERLIITQNSVNGQTSGVQTNEVDTELIRLTPHSAYEAGAYGESNASLTTQSNSGKVFYVKKTFNLIFNFDGLSTISGNSISVPVKDNETINLSGFGYKTLNVSGYTFGGWTTSSDHKEEGLLYNYILVNSNGEVNSAVRYWNGSSHKVVDDGKYVYDEDIILYPILTRNLPLDNQGATTAGTTSIEITFGEKLPLVVSKPTKTGYTFGGYYSQPNGAGTQYYEKNGALINYNKANESLGTATLYAKWIPNTYTVTLNNEGGSGTTSVQVTYGAVMSQITAPTKEGSVFGGYFTEQYGGGTKYYDVDGKCDHIWDIASNTTLHAYWYNSIIHFDSNGGTACADLVGETGDSITLPTPSRQYYTFNGWYLSETNNNGSGTQANWTQMPNLSSYGGTLVTGSNDVYEITLYAKWTLNDSYLPNNWVSLFNAAYSNSGSLNVTEIAFSNSQPSNYDTQIQIGTDSKAGTTIWNNSPLNVYVSTSGENTTLTFYAPNTIYAPANCSSLFAACTAGGDSVGLGFDKVSIFEFVNFDTSNTVNMRHMFDLTWINDNWHDSYYYNTSLKTLDLSGFNTSNVTDMSGMFYGLVNLKQLNLSGFTIGSNCDVDDIFYGCNELIYIKTPKAIASGKTLSFPTNVYFTTQNGGITRGVSNLKNAIKDQDANTQFRRSFKVEVRGVITDDFYINWLGNSYSVIFNTNVYDYLDTDNYDFRYTSIENSPQITNITGAMWHGNALQDYVLKITAVNK